MSNFQINNIIRCYENSDNGNIIFVETLGNGLIIDIQGNNVSICWSIFTDIIDKLWNEVISKIPQSDYPDSLYNISNLNNLNNFIYKSHKVCKKFADNDWVDKDGNRYNDAGVKQ